MAAAEMGHGAAGLAAVAVVPRFLFAREARSVLVSATHPVRVLARVLARVPSLVVGRKLLSTVSRAPQVFLLVGLRLRLVPAALSRLAVLLGRTVLGLPVLPVVRVGPLAPAAPGFPADLVLRRFPGAPAALVRSQKTC